MLRFKMFSSLHRFRFRSQKKLVASTRSQVTWYFEGSKLASKHTRPKCIIEINVSLLKTIQLVWKMSKRTLNEKEIRFKCKKLDDRNVSAKIQRRFEAKHVLQFFTVFERNWGIPTFTFSNHWNLWEAGKIRDFEPR